jgi:hypothetical protein
LTDAPGYIHRDPDLPALIEMLKEWEAGDEQEQKETLECLRKSLNESRPKGYEVIP